MEKCCDAHKGDSEDYILYVHVPSVVLSAFACLCRCVSMAILSSTSSSSVSDSRATDRQTHNYTSYRQTNTQLYTGTDKHTIIRATDRQTHNYTQVQTNTQLYAGTDKHTIICRYRQTHNYMQVQTNTCVRIKHSCMYKHRYTYKHTC